jgi:hypothetical protein
MNAKSAAKRWADGDTIEATALVSPNNWQPISKAGESTEPNTIDPGVFSRGSEYMFRLTKWWVPFNRVTCPQQAMWCLAVDVNRPDHKLIVTRVYTDGVILSDNRFVSYIDLFNHWIYSTDNGQTCNRAGQEISQ